MLNPTWSSKDSSVAWQANFVPAVKKTFVPFRALIGIHTRIVAIQIISRARNAGQAVLEWRRVTKAKGIVLHALLGAIPFSYKQGFAEVL